MPSFELCNTQFLPVIEKGRYSKHLTIARIAKICISVTFKKHN